MRGTFCLEFSVSCSGMKAASEETHTCVSVYVYAYTPTRTTYKTNKIHAQMPAVPGRPVDSGEVKSRDAGRDLQAPPRQFPLAYGPGARNFTGSWGGAAGWQPPKFPALATACKGVQC